jgi:tight adherence protein B
MMTLIAGLAGALLVAGVLGVLAGARRRPVVEGTPPRRGRGRPARWWVSLGRGTQVGAVVALAAGVLVGITSGFYLAVLVAPLAVVGLPYLLMRSTQAADIGRLEAMAEWTRNLSGVLTAGVNLEQALVVSLRSTPAPIEAEVSRLVGRLDARWRIEDALRAFAHDLADATGDLMVMELMLGARSRGAGLATVLAGVAESTAADVAARRAIEADRAKPRATARWVTILSSGAMVFFAFSGRFLDPYRTPSGQVLLGVLLAGYGFTLVQMRRMSTGRPFPRLLTDVGEG